MIKIKFIQVNSEVIQFLIDLNRNSKNNIFFDESKNINFMRGIKKLMNQVILKKITYSKIEI